MRIVSSLSDKAPSLSQTATSIRNTTHIVKVESSTKEKANFLSRLRESIKIMMAYT